MTNVNHNNEKLNELPHHEGAWHWIARRLAGLHDGLAGRPMTERERFHRDVLESHADHYKHLVS